MRHTLLKAAAVVAMAAGAACTPSEGYDPQVGSSGPDGYAYQPGGYAYQSGGYAYQPGGYAYQPGGYVPYTAVSSAEVQAACTAAADQAGYDVGEFGQQRIQPTGAEVEMRLLRLGPDVTVLCRYYAQTGTAELFGV